MSLPSFPSLVLRTEKGSNLSHVEGDENLKAIRSYSEMMASLIGSLFKEDGTLNDNVVTTLSIIDRAVTKSKLASTALPYFEDTSAVSDKFEITPSPSLVAEGYATGQIFFIKAGRSITVGANCTLNVNGMGEKSLLKLGGDELTVGDIVQNQVFCAIYTGSAFYVISGGGGSGGSGTSGGESVLGYNVYAPTDITLTGLTAPIALGPYSHALPQTPTNTIIDFVCYTAEYGYAVNDVVPLDEITDSTGAKPAFSVATNVTTIIPMLLSTPYIRQKTAGGGAIGDVVLLTLSKWKLRIRAEVVVSASAQIIESALQTFVTSNYPMQQAQADGLIFDVTHGLTFGKTVLTWGSPTPLILNNDTVTIGAKTYTFKTALTPTEGEVLLGDAGDGALQNLAHAVNLTGTPATDYSCAAVNPDVSSSEVSAHAITFTSKVSGLGAAISKSSSALTVATTTLATPKSVRGVLACKLGDVYSSGYSTGDELDISALRAQWGLSPTVMVPCLTTGCNATKVFMVFNKHAGTGTGLYIPDKSGGFSALTDNHWEVRAYVRL